MKAVVIRGCGKMAQIANYSKFLKAKLYTEGTYYKYILIILLKHLFRLNYTMMKEDAESE